MDISPADSSRKTAPAVCAEPPSSAWLLSPFAILTALLLTLPWFIAIGFISDGAFYAEALGRDFGAKLGGVQETHGGPPGYYLLTTLVMFWPGVIALPLAAVWAWRERRDPAALMLLCWLTPMWLVLELVPTKLPHYTLPLYPALALLCGAAVVRVWRPGGLRIIGMIVFAIVGLVLVAPGFIPLGALDFNGDPSLAEPAAAVVIVLALVGGIAVVVDLMRRRRLLSALALSGVMASVSVFAVGGWVAARGVAVSSAVARAADGRTVWSPDFREPSLVYLTGTDAKLSWDDSVSPGDIVMITLPMSGGVGVDLDCMDYLASANGYNYAKGEAVLGSLFTTDACEPAELETWRRTRAARATDGGS